MRRQRRSRPLDRRDKFGFRSDHMIGRSHQHHGVRVFSHQTGSSQRDARSGIPATRLDQDVLAREFRKLAPGFDCMGGSGHDPDAIVRRQRSATSDRLLNQRVHPEQR